MNAEPKRLETSVRRAGPRPAAMLLVLAIAASIMAADPTPPPGMALIPAGSYTPLYAKGAGPRTVEACFMDVAQVTNGQFLEFVKRHPEWRRSRVKRTQADANYLKHWEGDLELGDERLREAPVTHVSWFAARAYCEAAGKRLPSEDEWELVARADATREDASKDQEFLARLLEWYSRPATIMPGNVHEAAANVHGVRGMHGLVWEWVDDFNATMIVGDSRGDGSLERRLFCGAGSLLAADVSNYAAYMRYAFRSSLRGDYCVASLGFRGAKSIKEKQRPALTVPAASLYELAGEWRTQDDRPVKLAELRGKPRLITMGFASCKYACPRIIGDMKRIEAALGADAGKVGMVFFSFDTATDRPAKLKQTMTEHQLDPGRWTFAVADEETVRQLAVVLNFKFQSVEGFFAHSNLIALLDAEGNVVRREESLGAEIGPMVEAVRRLVTP